VRDHPRLPPPPPQRRHKKKPLAFGKIRNRGRPSSWRSPASSQRKREERNGHVNALAHKGPMQCAFEFLPSLLSLALGSAFSLPLLLLIFPGFRGGYDHLFNPQGKIHDGPSSQEKGAKKKRKNASNLTYTTTSPNRANRRGEDGRGDCRFVGVLFKPTLLLSCRSRLFGGPAALMKT